MKALNLLAYWKEAYLSLPRTWRLGAGLLLHAGIWIAILSGLALPQSSWAEWPGVQRAQFCVAYALLMVTFYYHNYELLPRQAGRGKMINYALMTAVLILIVESLHWLISFELRRRVYWSVTESNYLIQPDYYAYWLRYTLPFWLITLAWGWSRYFFWRKIQGPEPSAHFPKVRLMWLLHLLFWAGLLVINIERWGTAGYNLIETLSILLAAAVFYFNLLFLIDWGMQRGLSFYLLLAAGMVALAWPLDAWLHFLNANREPYGTQIAEIISYREALFSFSRLTVWPALLFSWVYYFFVRNIAEKTIALRAESESRLAELRALKSQIQPHFLLNVLNGLYAEALEEDSPKTAAGIVKLSKLMQYLVYETDRMWIPLSQELSFLDQYISLQEERLPPQVKVKVRWPDTMPAQLQIAPLLLLPAVENAFKHGVSLQHDSFITIQASIEHKRLRLYVENPLFPDRRPDQNLPGGVGLDNLKKRLNLLYPGKHSLQIQRDGGIFAVDMAVLLTDQLES